MADPVKNLVLDSIRNRARPTVDRPIDNMMSTETPETPTASTTPAVPLEQEPQPVKQVRRTLRLDSDANDLVKSMLGMGEGEVNIDVLVESLLIFVSEQPDDVKERVVAIAKSRAAKRRERSLRVREWNRRIKESQ